MDNNEGRIYKNLPENGGERKDKGIGFIKDVSQGIVPEEKGKQAGISPGHRIIENRDLSSGVFNRDLARTGDKGISLLKERARALASQSKYYEATSLLEEVDEDDVTELGMKLLMAECYLQLGRENKANRSIKDIRKTLSTAPTLDIDDVMGLIENLIENKSHTSALILLPVASDMYKGVTSPDDVIDGIFRCIKKASECTRPLIESGARSRILAIDFGIDYMADLLEDMKALKNADPEKIAIKQAFATNLIAFDYWLIRENQKGVKLRKSAAAAMEKALGPHAKQRRIYGNTYYNMGVGLDILNKHAEAKKAYETAIDAIESATDFDDESDRQNELKLCKQKIRELYK